MSDYNNIDIFDFFKDTLNNCGAFLLDMSDEEIGYLLFEEFDGDCVSFLNERNLNLLRQTGKITIEIVDMALELVSKFRALEHTEFWNVRSVRNNQKWHEILELSDHIKSELKVDVE